MGEATSVCGSFMIASELSLSNAPSIHMRRPCFSGMFACTPSASFITFTIEPACFSRGSVGSTQTPAIPAATVSKSGLWSLYTLKVEPRRTDACQRSQGSQSNTRPSAIFHVMFLP